jgi:hypothetical protein
MACIHQGFAGGFFPVTFITQIDMNLEQGTAGAGISISQKLSFLFPFQDAVFRNMAFPAIVTFLVKGQLFCGIAFEKQLHRAGLFLTYTLR